MLRNAKGQKVFALHNLWTLSNEEEVGTSIFRIQFSEMKFCNLYNMYNENDFA